VFITVAVTVVVVVVSAWPTNATADRLVHDCQQKPREKIAYDLRGSHSGLCCDRLDFRGHD
jgi:hypothetical protein